MYTRCTQTIFWETRDWECISIFLQKMVLDTLYETGISKTDVIDSCDEWDYSSNVIISQKRAKKQR